MTAARFDVVAERRRLEGSGAAELRQRYQEIGGARCAQPQPGVPGPAHPVDAADGRVRRAERAGGGAGGRSLVRRVVGFRGALAIVRMRDLFRSTLMRGQNDGIHD